MTLRQRLTNEVAGHMPARGFEDTALLVRQSAAWGYDQVVEPLMDLLEDIYQTPGVNDVLGDDLHERLRATLAQENR